MQIETINIDALREAQYNPRKQLRPGMPEYEKLKKSIIEFDYVDPVIWNRRTGNVVGGHQRIRVLRELGRTELQVSVVDLDDLKEKALNVALNKNTGDWDLPKLKDLLEELDTGAIDMAITGFDLNELEALFCNMPDKQAEGELPSPEFPETVPSVLFRVYCPEHLKASVLGQLKEVQKRIEGIVIQ